MSLQESETERDEVQSRVIGKPGIEPKFVLSQKDYRPTPFALSNYEYIGQRYDTTHFFPLELEVIPSENSRIDPMFEDFGGRVSQSERFVAGEKPVIEEAEGDGDGYVIDEAALQAELEAKYQEGFEVGRAAGEEAAKEVIAEKYEQLHMQLNGLTEEIRSQFAQTIATMEREALNLALQVARKILQTTAEAKPEYIAEVIRGGLQSLGGAKPLRIRLSPQDLEFLNVIGLPQDLSADELGVEYLADEAVKSGCIIDTDFGEVDLQLEHMWQQVRESLFGRGA